MNKKQFEELLRKNEKKINKFLKEIDKSSAAVDKNFSEILRAI